MEWFRSSKQRSSAPPVAVDDVAAAEPEAVKSTPADSPDAVFEHPVANIAGDLPLATSPETSPRTGYTVHSSREGQSEEAQFTSPTLTVARARMLFKSGSLVYVTDAAGRHFAPSEFGDILKFD